VLHPGHDLLPDEAALRERDAVKLVEQRLVRERIAEHEIAPALGHAERDAVRMIGVGRHERAARRCESGVGGSCIHDDPLTECRQARIRDHISARDLDRRNGRAAPCRRDDEALRHVADLDRRTQLVHRKPLRQRTGMIAHRVEQEPALGLHDDEIEQDLALRREQRRVERRRIG